MGERRQVAKGLLVASCLLAILAGLVLLTLAVWTLRDKTFLAELLRSRLYIDATYIALVSSTTIIALSAFGIFAAKKEIKCFILTYFVLLLLFTVVLIVGGTVAYVFREQVTWTLQAEMLTDLRSYRPGAGGPTTRAWDTTQSRLQCCGLLTAKVEAPWQMWRFNRALNPSPPPSSSEVVLPSSCCGEEEGRWGGEEEGRCRGSSPSLHPGDCLTLSLAYVREEAATLGAASLIVATAMVPGLISSLVLFRSII